MKNGLEKFVIMNSKICYNEFNLLKCSFVNNVNCNVCNVNKQDFFFKVFISTPSTLKKNIWIRTCIISMCFRYGEGGDHFSLSPKCLPMGTFRIDLTGTPFIVSQKIEWQWSGKFYNTSQKGAALITNSCKKLFINFNNCSFFLKKKEE